MQVTTCCSPSNSIIKVMSIILLSGACLVHNNKTLLLKQSKTSKHPGKWGPPGGHRKKNESFIEVALREIKEETNLDVRIKGLLQAGIEINSKDNIYFVVLYYATVKNPNKLKVDNPEISKYLWAGKKEIQNNKYALRNPFLKPVLIQALQHKYSPIDTLKIYSPKDFYI